MGRAPCCDKANVKRGPWSPEEDAKLKSYIEQHGTGGNWIALPQKIGLKRCGKSCRLRWLNYLRPNIKHGGFSEEEDNIICSLYISIGSRWSIIAAQLPGRTDNDIKNYWNTRLKKKLLGKHRKEQQQARRSGQIKPDIIRRSSAGSGGNNSSTVVQAADDQSPYWPELPVLAIPAVVPYSSSSNQQQQQQQQQPCFNDHASIRKLLIKLGGRFNSDVLHYETNEPIQDGRPTNLQLPVVLDNIPNYTTQQIYEHSSAPMPLISNTSDVMVSPHQFAQSHNYMVNTDNIVEDGVNMFQGQNSNYVTDQLKEMVYGNNNNTQSTRLDGLEFLYGEDMMNGESIGWGEMQLVCPPVHVASSSDDVYERLVPQELCAFSNGGSSSFPAGVQ